MQWPPFKTAKALGLTIPPSLLLRAFGMSPMPFWVFAVVSALGRMPGTLGAVGRRRQGRRCALHRIALAVRGVAALVVSLYYSRSRIVLWLRTLV